MRGKKKQGSSKAMNYRKSAQNVGIELVTAVASLQNSTKTKIND